MTNYNPPTGVWLPVITPFRDGQIDLASLERLIRFYASKPLSGIILAATTGEGQLLNPNEVNELAATSAKARDGIRPDLPLFMGLSGSDPAKLVARLDAMHSLPIDGYLISGPEYLRPSQEGVKQFYLHIAAATDRPILIYNIPYRTGINIENQTMLELAQVPNLVGVKDCCGSVEQSYDLLRRNKEAFSVLTGEDPFFYNALVHGAPGAIITGAHILVDQHAEILSLIDQGEQKSALEIWNKVAHIPRLLFAEPNPAPLKYWLWRKGLIDSPEVRLPFLPIGDALAGQIDQCIADFGYPSEIYEE